MGALTHPCLHPADYQRADQPSASPYKRASHSFPPSERMEHHKYGEQDSAQRMPSHGGPGRS
jgi:hypothetical protein